MIIESWAQRHGVSKQALSELRQLLHAASEPEFKFKDAKTEAGVQQRERDVAAKTGGILWRNNNGAAKIIDEKTKKERYIRYGLANDSKKVNKKVKSSDLIGIRPIKILPHHVGTTIGQFVAVECKEPGWIYTNSEREAAQLKFLTLVLQLGGEARFAS